jgi:hypothetical protein
VTRRVRATAADGREASLIRSGCDALIDRLGKLLQRIRGTRSVRWPWSSLRVADRGAALPGDHTGWTVHRDIALRLKNISVVADGASRGDPGSEVGAFKIRLAGSLDSRRDAAFLVHQRYARKGYRTSAKRVSPDVWTFAAYDEGRLAGTVSLRLDASDGLAADVLYRTEIDVIRRDKRKVCEFTRLAVDASRLSQPVLAGLFHTVYLFARRIRNYDFVVIEVNPRHVGFYRRSLGFQVIGSERYSTRVGAPAVLLGMSFEDIADHLQQHAGLARRAPRARSLYAYGFSPTEEAGVLSRLRTLDAGPDPDAKAWD